MLPKFTVQVSSRTLQYVRTWMSVLIESTNVTALLIASTALGATPAGVMQVTTDRVRFINPTLE